MTGRWLGHRPPRSNTQRGRGPRRGRFLGIRSEGHARTGVRETGGSCSSNARLAREKLARTNHGFGGRGPARVFGRLPRLQDPVRQLHRRLTASENLAKPDFDGGIEHRIVGQRRASDALGTIGGRIVFKTIHDSSASFRLTHSRNWSLARCKRFLAPSSLKLNSRANCIRVASSP